MFKVYEMSGNYSREVAMFEIESEASEFVCSKVEEITIEQLPEGITMMIMKWNMKIK
jgi:hypothetical protein